MLPHGQHRRECRGTDTVNMKLMQEEYQPQITQVCRQVATNRFQHVKPTAKHRMVFVVVVAVVARVIIVHHMIYPKLMKVGFVAHYLLMLLIYLNYYLFHYADYYSNHAHVVADV